MSKPSDQVMYLYELMIMTVLRNMRKPLILFVMHNPFQKHVWTGSHDMRLVDYHNQLTFTIITRSLVACINPCPHTTVYVSQKEISSFQVSSHKIPCNCKGTYMYWNIFELSITWQWSFIIPRFPEKRKQCGTVQLCKIKHINTNKLTDEGGE